MFANLDGLFAAGIGTTSNTIEYMMTLLAKEEKIQEQIYQELLKIVILTPNTVTQNDKLGWFL